jgi:transposase IS481 family protein/integrase-like protein
MKLHANARTCPHSRRLAVERVLEQGWTLAAAAEAAGVSVRSLSKWLRRFREEGEQGLFDRSSAPHRVPSRTPEERVAVIAGLRRLRLQRGRDRRGARDAAVDRLGGADPDRARPAVAAGAARAAEPLRAPPSGRARPHRREKARPDQRRCRQALRRRRRPPHAQLSAGRRRGWCPAANRRLGVRARLRRRHHPARLRRGARGREGDDGGRLPAPGDRALRRLRDPRRARDDRQRLLLPRRRPSARLPHARHQAPPHTPLPRPRTNGKAERFIRTLLGGWAYGAIYRDSEERRRALAGWLDFYNHRRPHGSLSHQPPLQRLEALRRNNVAGSYS